MDKNVQTLELDFSDLGGLMDQSLPDPSTVEFYRGLNNRCILWNTEIDDNLVELVWYILRWNREDEGLSREERKPICLLLNSDGGSVSAAMCLVDAIRLSETPVYTIGMGRVYSAAALLMIAGHKRFVLPGTTCLIHDGSLGASGDVGKMLDNLEFTKRQEARVRQYILEQTKIPASVFDANYRRDWFLFSEEMVEYGIADRVLTSLCGKV